MRLFGTSGIRGDAKGFFTDQLCFDLGRTFAQFLDDHRQPGAVAVGMDPRESSLRIKQALFQGLAFGGRKLFDEGMVPVPAMNWILKAAPLAGSVMVTGSHIEKELNGLKFYAFKEEILKDHEAEITKIYQQLKEKAPYQKKTIRVVQEKKAAESYQQMLVDLAEKPLPKLKVVVDPGNGAQSEIMPEVLEQLKLSVVAVNAEPTPEKFMSRDTESNEVFAGMAKLVKDSQADLGIIFDADGDRVVFVDEEGQGYPGDYSGALIAKHAKGSLVVTPINASQVVERVGKKVIRTKVGSPYVVAAMKKHQASFGFEGNGGGIFAEIMMTRDGGSSTVKVLNILKQEKKPLSQIMGALPKFFIFKTKTDCPWDLVPAIIKKAKENFKGVKVEEMDGLKIWVDKGSWILFRSSSNAPEFRVFTEAESQAKADKLGQEGIGFVKKVIKEEQK